MKGKFVLVFILMNAFFSNLIYAESFQQKRERAIETLKKEKAEAERKRKERELEQKPHETKEQSPMRTHPYDFFSKKKPKSYSGKQ